MRVWGLCATLAWLPAIAHALAPTTLPARSDVFYGGVGLSTFQYGSSGLIRDRQIRPGAEVIWGHGLSNDWGLWASSAVRYATTIEDPDRGPCPTDTDYCAPTLSLGRTAITLERQLLRAPLLLRGAISLGTDAYNAPTRSRWTNVGQGTSSLVGRIDAGKSWESGFEVALSANYEVVVGRRNEAMDQRVPPHQTGGMAAIAKRFGTVTTELGGSTSFRLGGVEYDEWVTGWRLTDDRWSALAYRELVLHGKVSLPLPHDTGLHVYIGQTAWAENGPNDTLHASVGWHKYFAPK